MSIFYGDYVRFAESKRIQLRSEDASKNWDNFFALKINKFIGAGLGFTLFYDNDQPGQKNKKTTDQNGNVTMTYGPLGWIQMKQTLNVGFSYKL
jgi:hypothetical protein